MPPTLALRDDDPSRDAPVRPPRVPRPRWLLLLGSGQFAAAAQELDAPGCAPRALGRWALLGGALFAQVAPPLP
eukprot:6296281-Lingulodinium_polyedra.AAC.1